MSDTTPIIIRLDPEMEEIVPKYLTNRAKDCVVLREHVASGNLAEIKRMGHNMKGTGGGYGFDEITRLGDAIEQAALAGNVGTVPALVDELAAYLARVKPVYK
jgi:HPt (histidine-containing phosphotransfer) domain-containing protein